MDVGRHRGNGAGDVMVFDLDLTTFTLIHTAISVVALLTGLAVLQGLLRGQRLKGWTALFLLSAIVTSVTGLAFPTADFDMTKNVAAIWRRLSWSRCS